MSTVKSLVPNLVTSLKAFQSSSTSFKVISTVPPNHTPSDLQTLFILDLSFNPPSKAHFHLARCALQKSFQYTHPCRLVLLFSTRNADKAPVPASFQTRLALMTLFAQDLFASLQSSEEHHDVSIDIALTKAPFYTDKSIAIAQSAHYPSQPRHVHIMGFDTITRFLGTKYYQDHDPPLAAVAPYFDAGHEVRVSIRPSNEFGTVEQQKKWIESIASGEMGQGASPEWAKQISVIEPTDEDTGISSTRIRDAASTGQADLVWQLCTPLVARAILHDAIYDSTNSEFANA